MRNKKPHSNKHHSSGKKGGKKSFSHDKRPEQGVASRGQSRSVLPETRILYGIHACKAALFNPSRHIKQIWITKEHPFLSEQDTAGALQEYKTHIVPRHSIDEMLADNSVHQNICMEVEPLAALSLDAVLKNKENDETGLFIVLDQVTDPHNIGAILRSACVFGALGVIVQDKNTPPITATAAKIACGAAEHTPLIRETNIARAIELLQKHGYWCMGLDERGELTLKDAIGSSRKVGLVMGAEGPGLRRLVAEQCDQLVQLPTFGALSSLNVSNASAISLYECAVQLTPKP